jgi:hypothetical protein
VEFSGKINSIKPRYSTIITKKHPKIYFDGFLLNFAEGFINFRHFLDFIYAPISSRMQGKFCFAKGDSVSFNGYLREENGMLLIKKIRCIEIMEKLEKHFWTESRAKVAQRIGSILPYQSEKCYLCDKGTLLKHAENNPKNQKSPRILFCLEGVEDPEVCCYSISNNLAINKCCHEQDPYII